MRWFKAVEPRALEEPNFSTDCKLYASLCTISNSNTARKIYFVNFHSKI